MNYKAIGGILLVDKPTGPTSHDIVDCVRRETRFKKVGHAGTLDPMATGLLIILLGKYTKRSSHFSDYDKEYEATLLLGVSTDSGDKEGNIVEQKELDPAAMDKETIEKVFGTFCGDTEQIPPMYSAKKIKGKKLYELARKGVVIEREPKKVSIKEIKILNMTLPEITFCVKCSKGTYIRQLAHDIGEKLHCGAHLTSLRRTKIGPFSVEKAISLKENNILNENILQPE